METIIGYLGGKLFTALLIALIAIPYFGLYWIIKQAVKNGVKEALKDESIKEANREAIKKGSLDAIRQINFDEFAKRIGAEVRKGQTAQPKGAEQPKEPKTTESTKA